MLKLIAGIATGRHIIALTYIKDLWHWADLKAHHMVGSEIKAVITNHGNGRRQAHEQVWGKIPVWSFYVDFIFQSKNFSLKPTLAVVTMDEGGRGIVQSWFGLEWVWMGAGLTMRWMLCSSSRLNCTNLAAVGNLWRLHCSSTAPQLPGQRTNQRSRQLPQCIVKKNMLWILLNKRPTEQLNFNFDKSPSYDNCCSCYFFLLSLSCPRLH